MNTPKALSHDMTATACSEWFVWSPLECSLCPTVTTWLYLNCLECPERAGWLWISTVNTSWHLCCFGLAKKHSPVWSPFQKGGGGGHLREQLPSKGLFSASSWEEVELGMQKPLGTMPTWGSEAIRTWGGGSGEGWMEGKRYRREEEWVARNRFTDRCNRRV